MQENKFENQVQKIMDQLSLDPEDSVWENVAKGIEKDKKRKRPLFWILFIAGPVFIGAGYLLVSTAHVKNPSSGNIRTTADSADRKPVSSGISTAPGRNEPGEKTGFPGQASQVIVHRNIPVEKPGGNISATHSDDKGGYQAGEVNTESGKMDSGKSATADVNSVKGIKNDSDSALLNKTVLKENTSDSDSLTNRAKSNNQKTGSWKFGITAGIGMSEIHQGPSNLNYVNLPSTGNPGGSPGPIYSSNPGSGLSFSAGGFLSRSLSTRISLSGGLNYHYYSSKVNIGNQVSNSGANYNSNLQYATSRYYVNNGSYSHTNQYHFAELPLWIDFRLNKSQKIPVYLEAGFSYAYLISTNALYFDPSANVYYKNRDLFNRSQWNANTALLIGLNMHHSRLLAGPQFQYGMSGLLKSSAGYSQHLLSYGLKISFIPNIK